MQQSPIVYAPDAERMILATSEEMSRFVEFHARDSPCGISADYPGTAVAMS